ncbi:MAG TPA: hypothetical protein VM123_14440 [archaeon]|nr:hypothetical protein [archaeon]
MISRIAAMRMSVLALAAVFLNSGPASAQQPCPPMHCQLIRAGEIEAIVGDGAGHRIRPGIWAMSSIDHQFSIFKNLSSGMLTGEFRGKANTKLEYVDDSTSLLKREPTTDYPTRARMYFRMKSPYYLDTELTLSDTEDKLAGKPYDFRSVSFNCYANSPFDIRIHYLSGGQWERYIPPYHAAPGTAIKPSYLSDDEIEVWPDIEDKPFNWGKWYEKSFDEPFYYGRYEHMVMILIFDRPRWIRFYISPSGGGKSLIAGQESPAWDFEWIIPRKDYQPNQEYTFRVRLVYKKYVDDDDVLREVRKAQDDLGFEKVAPR